MTIPKDFKISIIFFLKKIEKVIPREWDLHTSGTRCLGAPHATPQTYLWTPQVMVRLCFA
jgi:hypothetical protein